MTDENILAIFSVLNIECVQAVIALPLTPMRPAPTNSELKEWKSPEGMDDTMCGRTPCVVNMKPCLDLAMHLKTGTF